jgi:hypothetical protein
MTEEFVTLSVMRTLIGKGWTILTYDYPKSGTGIMLHPEERGEAHKNKASIIPDIVAVKKDIVLFFENKNKFFLPDFLKLQEIRDTSRYDNSIANLLSYYAPQEIIYGVTVPDIPGVLEKCLRQTDKIDLLLSVNQNGNVTEVYPCQKISILDL